MYGDNSNNRIVGSCPLCGKVIREAYGDKLHKVCYCTGCGLEYGNPFGGGRHSPPRKVITQVEAKRMIDEAYWALIKENPRLDVKVFWKCLDIVAIRMTGFGMPETSYKQLQRWGYTVVAGYISRLDKPDNE